MVDDEVVRTLGLGSLAEGKHTSVGTGATPPQGVVSCAHASPHRRSSVGAEHVSRGLVLDLTAAERLRRRPQATSGRVSTPLASSQRRVQRQGHRHLDRHRRQGPARRVGPHRQAPTGRSSACSGGRDARRLHGERSAPPTWPATGEGSGAHTASPSADDASEDLGHERGCRPAAARTPSPPAVGQLENRGASRPS